MANQTMYMNLTAPLNVTFQSLSISSWEKAAFTTGLTLLSFVTLIGNILVVVSFTTYRPLRTVTNYFIVSLALSDILVAVISMPVWITFVLLDMNFSILGGKLLKAWTCFDIMTGVASILNLTAVSVDRCIHITLPFAYPGYIVRRRVVACIIAIWILSAGLSMIKGIHFQWEKPNYEMLISMLGFFLPLAVILCCYVKIYQVARLQQKKCRKQTHCQKRRNSLKKDMKAIKTIAIVILAFFICWCPFFILNLYHGFCNCPIESHLITFAKWLHYANSALNPIIYACFNKDYRTGFRNALLKRCLRLRSKDVNWRRSNQRNMSIGSVSVFAMTKRSLIPNCDDADTIPV